MEQERLHKINWSESTWFFDIDDTLTDTASTSVSASKGIQKAFENWFGKEKAIEVRNNFNGFFDLLMIGYRVKNEDDWGNVKGGKPQFDTLISEIEKYQAKIIKKYGAIKKWSREVLIKIASDQANISATPEMIHKAANAFWITLTEETTLLPGTLKLLNKIKEKQRPIFLITSSDARLKMSDDGLFDYDPSYSEALKRERIELLREKGIYFNAVSIGDPEDKPHRDFFEKGIKLAQDILGENLNLSNSIMIGDSFAGDLQTPKEIFNFGLVVLFQKGKKEVVIVDSHQINTGDLSRIINYFV